MADWEPIGASTETTRRRRRRGPVRNGFAAVLLSALLVASPVTAGVAIGETSGTSREDPSRTAVRSSSDRGRTDGSVATTRSERRQQRRLERRVARELLAAAAAAVPTETATLVRAVDTSKWSPASPDPSGVTYRPSRDRLIVVDSEVDEQTGAGYHGVNLWEVTRAGVVTDTGTTLPYTNEPTGVGFDPATETLFVSTDVGNKIFVVRAGPDGRFGTSDDTRTTIDTKAYGLGDTEDPAYDPVSGHLFFVNGTTADVYDLDPVNGVFGDGDDRISHFDVTQYGARDTEGLALDPERGTLLVGDRPSDKIFEVTKAGALLRIINVGGIAGLRRISGLGVAPATVGSGLHYWIVDRAVDNGPDPRENDGMMFEISVSGGGTPANTPPTVNAGPDQAVTLPSSATLQGTVSDDGLPDPPGATTSAWSKVSGPGTVVFANASSASTSATFSTDGTYVLRLTADDSAAQTSDQTTVTVLPEGGGGPGGVIEVPVSVGADDAEETSAGRVRPASSDLELVQESTIQTVGLRFDGVPIPIGATVTNAYVQFRSDEVGSVATSLVISGEATDDAAPIVKTLRNISSRQRTASAVGWEPPPWLQRNLAGADQRTPNLAAVIQEIVSRTGWTSGNAVVLIVEGSGKRTADSFEGSWAPILHVEYQTG